MMRRVMASGSWEGMPIKAKHMDEGRCVKTIVLIFPNRRAMEAAARMEIAEMMLVVKKRVPMVDSEREKRRWK